MNLQITFVRVTNNSYFCTHKSKTDILTMKLKVFVLAALLATGTASSMTLKNNRTNGDVMSKEADGTYVVNTTTLAKDVKGFKGNTPLYIYIKGGKVVKVLFVMELAGLKGRERLRDYDVDSLIIYPGK